MKGYYEDFHGVAYTEDAIEAAVKLSVKHIHERFLPDKAIDVIDEAGSFVRLHHDKVTNHSQMDTQKPHHQSKSILIS